MTGCVNNSLQVHSEKTSSPEELRKQSIELLGLIITATRSGKGTGITRHEGKPVLDLPAATSKTRAAQGFSPTETATFVFSIKQPIISGLKKEAGSHASL